MAFPANLRRTIIDGCTYGVAYLLSVGLFPPALLGSKLTGARRRAPHQSGIIIIIITIIMLPTNTVDPTHRIQK